MVNELLCESMKVIAIIPARMASTRFPGKPLADILGIPMIEHVRRRVALCSHINEVVVATCDLEIYELVSNNGGRAVMTSRTHERCTDRVAEAASSIDADIIINVQGDEPLVRPEMFELLLKPLLDEAEVVCTNLTAEIGSEDEFNNPNIVKTVFDCKTDIIYFSREPIPSLRKSGGLSFKKYKQLGIIAFRKDFLLRFTHLPPTLLEMVESVDMLRAIEHGYKIRMVLSPFRVFGVDTPVDLVQVTELMKSDDIFNSYIKR